MGRHRFGNGLTGLWETGTDRVSGISEPRLAEESERGTSSCSPPIADFDEDVDADPYEDEEEDEEERRWLIEEADSESESEFFAEFEDLLL